MSKGAFIGVIVGSVVGGIILGVGMLSLVFFVRTRRQTKREQALRNSSLLSRDRLIDEQASPMELGADGYRIELSVGNRSEMWTEPIELPVIDHEEMRRKGWI